MLLYILNLGTTPVESGVSQRSEYFPFLSFSIERTKQGEYRGICMDWSELMFLVVTRE